MGGRKADEKWRTPEILRSKISGMTFMEVLVSAVLAALIVGATMSAFVAALNIALGWKGPVLQAKAAAFTQQTLERFRNKIACRQSSESSADTWYDASCAAAPPSGPQPDPLPSGALPAGSRQYTVTPVDCDGVGGSGDCLQVRVKVQWTPPQ